MDKLYGSKVWLPTDPEESDTLLSNKNADMIVSTVSTRRDPTVRITNQQGHFMLCHNVSGDIDRILRETLRDKLSNNNPPLAKLTITADLKPHFMRRLKHMNIASRILFPGLDGIGGDITEQIRHRL